jgi:predicted secreted protein
MTAVVAAVGLASCSDVALVDRVVIRNPTEYTARVEVRGAERGWLALTTVSADATSTVERVIDQGPSWIFRFSYGGVEVETTHQRDDLARSGWRVEVPSEFETELRSEGVEPPP